ncbi:MAG: molybdopterin-dependent oxidoreductase [Eubacteriales bacterium]|nr:molybdopterin-dependent oxidoreductase [Eubacteriales bacterium]
MDKSEALKKAKIACPETGIEIRHTLCGICSPSNNCGVDAYVKDGRLVKVEGTDSHPKNHGLLCAKGQSNREFIYRKDRILTPLRRCGARGEGRFEPVTWEEAYREIAERLGKIREQDGADAVAFFGGYNKWYRPWLRRFAHSFGTFNYGTESSSCMTSFWMAWKTAAGQLMVPDFKNTDLVLGWAFNPFYSGHLQAKRMMALKEKGTKFLIIDPRITLAAEKLADLHLRPWPGTDGALALCMANVLIQKGWIDREYIEAHVHGFEPYAEYVKQFNEENIEKLTGVSYAQVEQACAMIHESSSMAVNGSSAPLPHHRNGFQNLRAIHALLAITGNIDCRGGELPGYHTFTHQVSGYLTGDEEFADETEPEHIRPAVGEERFPLWFHMEREMQAMDLARQILEKKPYPIRAVFAMGMNYRMFPDDETMKRALGELDFFVDTDLFMTDTAMLADLVLPVCSSFERGEFMSYEGGYAWYTNPVIDRVGDCKSDVEILSDLAKVMDLGDEKLAAGYEANIAEMTEGLGVTVDQLKASDTPLRVEKRLNGGPGQWLKGGFPTKTGKFELYSELIAEHPQWKLDPLPTYREPLDEADPAEYPFRLCSGGRLPGAIHSRLHKVPWVRSMRPDPMADISLEDAEALGLKEGDDMEIFTERGAVTVKANPTSRVPEGVVFLFHGYSEADVNSLMSGTHLDPYSGFPAYNSTRCGMRKKVTS